MNFLTGCRYYLDGLRLIFQPGLRRFVIFPLMLNILIFTAFLFVSQHYLQEFNHWFVSYLPSWLQWLTTLIWLFFFLSFFLFIVYTFVLIANIISAPFNSLLAEKVESHLTGIAPSSRSTTEILRDFPKSMMRQLSLLGYFLPRAVFILILFFIPVIQAFAVFIWFVFNAWMMAITYLDYPTENQRIPIRELRAWLAGHQATGLGFGICVLVMAMIPVINLFTIPAAVAGATKLWVAQQKRR